MDDMEKIAKVAGVLSEHVPKVLTVMGAVGSIITMHMDIRRQPNYWLMMYKVTGDEHYLIKYLQATKSNNWLRMHGYPMRRRRH